MIDEILADISKIKVKNMCMLNHELWYFCVFFSCKIDAWVICSKTHRYHYCMTGVYDKTGDT